MISLLRRGASALCMRLGRRRVEHARSRAAAGRPSASEGRIAVVLAAEERWDDGGGAVTTWVRAVYRRLGRPAVVWTADPHDTCDGLPACSPAGYRAFERALRSLCGRLAVLTGRSADTIHLRLIAGGRLWVWAIAPHLVGAAVVHVHNRPSYAAWLRRLGVTEPIILHAHNDLVGAAGAAARRSADSADAAEIVGSADHIVCCSDHVRTTAEEAFGPLPATVVHNGVDTAAVPWNAQPPTARTAIWAGRLVPEKGGLEAVAVSAALAEAGWSLTLVGGTPGAGRSGYAVQIDAAVARSPQVRHIGFIPHRELLGAYGEHAVFLFPCQWPEPFGMVIVEAMAAGAVVIAPAVGGIPEIIEHDRTGILLPGTATPADYAAAITALTPAHMNAIRTAARQAVVERFDWSHTAARFTEVLDRLDLRPGAHTGADAGAAASAAIARPAPVRASTVPAAHGGAAG